MLRGMKPTTLNEALDLYELEHIAGLKEATKHNYVSTLEAWRRWVVKETQPNVYLEDIEATTMARYFNTLRPPRLAEVSFNVHRGVINRFWIFCIDEGLVRLNPMRRIAPLSVPEKERTRLSGDELERLLEMATNPRDRIAIAMGMNTGLRAGDLSRLKIGQINLTNNWISVSIGKTGRRDELPIEKELRAELLRWYEAYAELLGLDSMNELSNDYYLIPPMRGQIGADGRRGHVVVLRPTERYKQPQAIVHKALVKMGINTHREGFHTLRRSAARAVFDQAAAKGDPNPIRVAMTFLGHKNQATTELYIGKDFDQENRNQLLRGQSFISEVAEREREANRLLDEAGEAPMRLGRRRHA